MRNYIVALILNLSFVCTSQAQAPPSIPPLDQVAPGYSPTVFTSRDQVQKVFDEMPWSFKAPSLMGLNQGSQCYMRAQIWTYDFARNQNIKAMKAFVFYTHAYKEAYKKIHNKKFDWWYHVTPYVLLKNPETQKLQELALDATFSDELLDMKPWTDLFVDTKRKCAEFVPYKQFKCEVEGVNHDEPGSCSSVVFGSEHCYLVRVPATIYEPQDIEAYQAGLKNGLEWDRHQLVEAVKKAPLKSSEEFWQSRLDVSKREVSDWKKLK